VLLEAQLFNSADAIRVFLTNLCRHCELQQRFAAKRLETYLLNKASDLVKTDRTGSKVRTMELQANHIIAEAHLRHARLGSIADIARLI
jgi:hypothetical protein